MEQLPVMVVALFFFFCLENALECKMLKLQAP